MSAVPVIGQRGARDRLAIGTLSHLPKSGANTRFEPNINILAEVAVIARKRALSPDDAVKHWQQQRLARPHPVDDPIKNYCQDRMVERQRIGGGR